MSTAVPVEHADSRGDHDAMMLLIPGALWKVLVLQGKGEGRSPGDVLNSAIREYLERSGSPEAVEYLWRLKECR